MSNTKTTIGVQAPFATGTARRLLALYPHWHFFRIDPGTKAGGMPRDNLDTGATNDSKAIASWPSACNVGVALAKSGLVVADVDVKPGKRGAVSLGILELECGPLPETYTVRSGSGGAHYYYAETASVRHVQGQNRFGAGIDSPGYVLIAGSQVGGKLYRTVVKAPRLAPAPDWFAAYLAPAIGDNSSPQAPAVELDTPDLIAAAIHFLTRDAKPAVQGQNGEFRLLMTAAVLKDIGISKERAIDLLAEHYNGRCSPPWDIGDGAPADRLEVKVANAWAYLRQTTPGAHTPQVAFATESIDAAALDKTVAWWKEFNDRPRPMVKTEGFTFQRRRLW